MDKKIIDLITNESEINRRLEEKELIKKYEIVKNLNIKEKEFNNIFVKNKQEENDILSKEVLDKIIELLFGISSESIRIKEKTIDYTIKYFPNLKEVFKGIIDSTEDELFSNDEINSIWFSLFHFWYG